MQLAVAERTPPQDLVLRWITLIYVRYTDAKVTMSNVGCQVMGHTR